MATKPRFDRRDIRRPDPVPKYLNRFLAQVGGHNPYGEPMWRLVWAKSVVWMIAGGKVWDDNLTLAERGGVLNPNARPLRDDYGKLVQRLKFPHADGWLLQIWKSPRFYPREHWFAPQHLMPDGTPKLGPYPENGDYECTHPPMVRLPSENELGSLLNAHWKALSIRSASLEQRVLDTHNYCIYEDRRREKALVADFVLEANDLTSYLRSNTLTAGKIRTQRAEKLGIREHVGN